MPFEIVIPVRGKAIAHIRKFQQDVLAIAYSEKICRTLGLVTEDQIQTICKLLPGIEDISADFKKAYPEKYYAYLAANLKNYVRTDFYYLSLNEISKKYTIPTLLEHIEQHGMEKDLHINLSISISDTSLDNQLRVKKILSKIDFSGLEFFDQGLSLTDSGLKAIKTLNQSLLRIEPEDTNHYLDKMRLQIIAALKKENILYRTAHEIPYIPLFQDLPLHPEYSAKFKKTNFAPIELAILTKSRNAANFVRYEKVHQVTFLQHPPLNRFFNQTEVADQIKCRADLDKKTSLMRWIKPN